MLGKMETKLRIDRNKLNPDFNGYKLKLVDKNEKLQKVADFRKAGYEIPVPEANPTGVFSSSQVQTRIQFNNLFCGYENDSLLFINDANELLKYERTKEGGNRIDKLIDIPRIDVKREKLGLKTIHSISRTYILVFDGIGTFYLIERYTAKSERDEEHGHEYRIRYKLVLHDEQANQADQLRFPTVLGAKIIKNNVNIVICDKANLSTKQAGLHTGVQESGGFEVQVYAVAIEEISETTPEKTPIIIELRKKYGLRVKNIPEYFSYVTDVGNDARSGDGSTSNNTFAHNFIIGTETRPKLVAPNKQAKDESELGDKSVEKHHLSLDYDANETGIWEGEIKRKKCCGKDEEAHFPQYTWIQEDRVVILTVDVPKNLDRLIRITKNDIECIFEDKKLTLKCRHNGDLVLDLDNEPLYGHVMPSQCIWTIEDNSILVIYIVKDQDEAGVYMRWPQVFERDDETCETMDPAEVARIREALMKFTASGGTQQQQDSFYSNGNADYFYNQQNQFMSELDDLVDYNTTLSSFYIIDEENGNINQVVDTSGMDYLCTSFGSPGQNSNYVCLKYDVDGILFKIEPKPSHHSTTAWNHSKTLNALGFVMASKSDKKFVYVDNNNCDYFVISESSKRLYIYNCVDNTADTLVHNVIEFPLEYESNSSSTSTSAAADHELICGLQQINNGSELAILSSLSMYIYKI
ncbi:NudC domain-containing protein 1 [Zancudomyces culisetae]|uniref:NudC domain-containing protein 1 n=1 Tax=Zancudomyces culisetae TaxID=1213189 RepID=A0A1R1PZK6_ZANCU|nr:NudC domain-containing protein 1 [Zancudomyces culisetae]|eukprot:OMH86391.1 NudC domain-containing protein 1 [Zancudomyces culisetae]